MRSVHFVALKKGMLAFVSLLLISIITMPAWAQDNCEKLSDLAERQGIYIPGSDSERRVIGVGRLKFYSAPNVRCKMEGIFILPKEKVDAYTEYSGYTSVVYLNLKNGDEVRGWVKSDRLQPTGLGIAPQQP